MSNIYVPFEDLSFFTNYYYNEDLSLIYATNDFYNYSIVDLKNHYNVFQTTNINVDTFYSIDNNYLTNNWTYRTDFVDICFGLFFMILFFFGIPLFLISRLFKKKY